MTVPRLLYRWEKSFSLYSNVVGASWLTRLPNFIFDLRLQAGAQTLVLRQGMSGRLKAHRPYLYRIGLNLRKINKSLSGPVSAPLPSWLASLAGGSSNQTCLPAKLESRQEIASSRLEDQNPNRLF